MVIMLTATTIATAGRTPVNTTKGIPLNITKGTPVDTPLGTPLNTTMHIRLAILPDTLLADIPLAAESTTSNL